MTEYVIKMDGNDIISIQENGEILNKHDADQVWVWMMECANTCQYPENDE